MRERKTEAGSGLNAPTNERTLDGYVYWLAFVFPIIRLELILRERIVLGRRKIRSFRLHDATLLLLLFLFVFLSLRRRWYCPGYGRLLVGGEAEVEEDGEWKGKRESVEYELAKGYHRRHSSSGLRNAPEDPRLSPNMLANLPGQVSPRILYGDSKLDAVVRRPHATYSGAWRGGITV